ncbi:amidase family protein [Heyndrickxia oleronia]|uniref:amidase family protein n=1 Tax=Heyndrickxia oleronia TaxID=38875 RepID=UPI00203C9D1E|nr:amidase family protein [Heyndrickxia oleronia]MCM3240537.1 amidase family protein [Heyndrickxia oleronia]
MEFLLKESIIEERTITQLQESMEKGELTSKELVMYYLYKIAKYDQDGPRINSILEINPDAIFIAEGLDHERKMKGSRGVLHGIPILIKDNIETKDNMHTSAGTLALEQYVGKKDAFLVERLRHAGAVILGKANMTELANGMSSKMWAGYSSRGGQVVNPYGSEFFVGGSSTGSAAAVASNFTAVAIGTETDGSILSPAVQHSVVGIKPTTGLISRTGIIPFTYSQDTAGPMARTVEDAAILLGMLTGVDSEDPATYKSEGMFDGDYTHFLDEQGLKGTRIGVFTQVTEDSFMPGEYDEALFQQAIQIMQSAGAKMIVDIDLPSLHREWSWSVNYYELKHSLENFLNHLPAHFPVHSIRELIEFNRESPERTLKYGQDKLEIRGELTNTLRESNYLLAKLEDLYYARDKGIDEAIETYQLDAILFPAYVGSTICAKAGYPSIALPAGFMENGRPFGITLASGAFKEGTLIKLGYAFEKAGGFRRRPLFS